MLYVWVPAWHQNVTATTVYVPLNNPQSHYGIYMENIVYVLIVLFPGYRAIFFEFMKIPFVAFRQSTKA
jgi:hypothetical protein